MHVITTIKTPPSSVSEKLKRDIFVEAQV